MEEKNKTFSKNLHNWNITAKEAIKIQEDLSKKVIIKNEFSKIKKIAGADAAYLLKEENKVIAAVVLFSFPELEVIEYSFAIKKVYFPYIPGLLTFREGPALVYAIKQLNEQPDLIMFDGQGIAHPRGLGIASHLGVALDMVTIGCAKKRLIGRWENLGEDKGEYVPLIKNGKRIGVVLRSRKGVKPIFVSPGHKIDIETSVDFVLKCLSRFRLPEPTRKAHQLCEKIKKEGLNFDKKELFYNIS